ncbi:MAG: molybdopterin molybdotransferase MoeA [Halioglobus sp.]
MKSLLTLDDALNRVLSRAGSPPDVQSCPLLAAGGRVLAKDVTSTLDVPGADNSAMDGYALRAGDAGSPLPVVQRIAAGAVGAALQPGSAARIFTGAPLPAGADAVVMQENCSEKEGVLFVDTAVKVGENMRPRGQDIAAGAMVLSRGRRLRPQDLGLLASVGQAEVLVYRPLRVAILSTGDELVEPGQPLHGPAQLYNSNRYTLTGLLHGLGMEVIDLGIVPDDPEATALALEQGAAQADCVISSGGVSVGEEDHVKSQVEALGELTLWKLAIKPGKPLAFGAVAETPFIGLPGNPTSVFVTFCLIARPFLLKRQGVQESAAVRLTARAAFEVKRPGSRQDYLRVSLREEQGELVAQRYSNQSSGVLSSVSHSDALAVVPAQQSVANGDWVQVIPLDSFY